MGFRQTVKKLLRKWTGKKSAVEQWVADTEDLTAREKKRVEGLRKPRPPPEHLAHKPRYHPGGRFHSHVHVKTPVVPPMQLAGEEREKTNYIRQGEEEVHGLRWKMGKEKVKLYDNRGKVDLHIVFRDTDFY